RFLETVRRWQMGGIAGACGNSNLLGEANHLKHLLNSMRRRGPDGEEVIFAYADGRVQTGAEYNEQSSAYVASCHLNLEEVNRLGDSIAIAHDGWSALAFDGAILNIL